MQQQLHPARKDLYFSRLQNTTYQEELIISTMLSACLLTSSVYFKV
jgi:hypothetical protein